MVSALRNGIQKRLNWKCLFVELDVNNGALVIGLA